MSIPLVQNNEKDSINTSIIAIKRNIERINMLLGLSNSEEIDTSKFATKEELQQAVTDLQPVDEVALNNMHSVSSNAVAESLSYSTTEQKTGGVWIDGKPIYRKVFKTQLTRSGDNCWESDLPVATVKPRRYEVLREVNDSQVGLISYNDGGCYLWPNATYWRLDFANAPIGIYVIIIIEYTKTTD